MAVGGLGIKIFEQGAVMSVFVVILLLFDGIGGCYFEDCNEVHWLLFEFQVEIMVFGVVGYALDLENAACLWELFEFLIG